MIKLRSQVSFFQWKSNPKSNTSSFVRTILVQSGLVLISCCCFGQPLLPDTKPINVGDIRFDSKIDSTVNVSIVFGSSYLTLPEPLAQEKSYLPGHAKWIRVPNCAHVIMWNHRETTIKLIKETAGV
jgi:hypothetical protein